MPSFLSAKERRKFDAGLLASLDVVDADPAQKLYRYRKVPGAARAPTAAYELSCSTVLLTTEATLSGLLFVRNSRQT